LLSKEPITDKKKYIIWYCGEGHRSRRSGSLL